MLLVDFPRNPKEGSILSAKSNDFTDFDTVSETFEQVLAASTADETELVWFERRYGVASYPQGADDFLEPPRLSVLVRVVEGRRQGWYRTETPDPHLLESGVRQAMALAKVQPPVKRRPVLPKPQDLHFQRQIVDRKIADLDLEGGHALVASWCEDADAPEGLDIHGRLHWSVVRVAVFNSHGLRRRGAATEMTLEVVAGRNLDTHGTGAGHAAASSRLQQFFAPQKVVQRAIDRHVDAATAPPPEGSVKVLLAPEATIALLNLLNTYAFSGRAYLDGTSFLTKHRNIQVFDRQFNLHDDGTRVPGMPFPFDLEGTPKRPLDLITQGQPSTPALNRYQGAEAGLEPTAQAVGGADSMFGNLFLGTGEASHEELLAAADGGLYIGWLEPPECFDPGYLHFRTIARSVRRIENGRLGAPLDDLVWEESLLKAFARIAAIGNESVVHTTRTTLLGAICAPALVLIDVEGFRTANVPKPETPND